MTFYARGRKEKNFEIGIAKALEAILASPQFLFRVEETRRLRSTSYGAAGSAATQPIASATTSWRRGCRSSSGDAGPMRN